MAVDRRWSLETWKSDINSHPILSRLCERIVWSGLDTEGRLITTFRPTPEGDLFDAEGGDADLSNVTSIGIAHGARLDRTMIDAWRQHLKDFEVPKLFGQFARPVLKVAGDLAKADMITDREGWLMEAFTLRGGCQKRGYDRGAPLDGGCFTTYCKTFASADIVAEIHFTGSNLPEENIPAALVALQFTKGRTRTTIKLADVPPALLSECWNDFHDIAEAGNFDTDWKNKGLGYYYV